MGYLLFVTLIQAFSFSLIGEYLAGHVDSYFAVLTMGLLINLLIWNQHEDLGRLFLGGGVILAAMWVSRLGVRRA